MNTKIKAVTGYLAKLFSRRAVWIPVAVVVAIITLFQLFGHKNGNAETFVVEKDDFVNVTEVSGKVIPGEEINLSFEAAGLVSSLNFSIGDTVSRGQVLARLDSDEINSEISEAVANLRVEEARLSEISGNEGDQNKLNSSRTSLISTLKKSYVSADGILKNTVDVFVDEPYGSSPEFNKVLVDYFLRREIETKRYSTGVALNNWKSAISNYSVESISLKDAEYATDALKTLEDLLATISLGTNDFDSNTQVTQSQIDAYINSIESARTTVAGLIVEINSATEAVRAVQAELPIIQASINGANATINKLSAKSRNYVIAAPFDGVITSDDVEIGQVVSAGENVLSMVSNAAFEVESFVPEVSIAGVDVGDNVRMTFDAFGPDVYYEGFVAHIDPRETVKDGLTTYRILVGFNENHEEVLSGMNVEIEIEKERLADQIIIPRYLVQSDETGNFVEVKVAGSSATEKRNVILGKKDSRGNVIIESGVSIGDEIILPNKDK